MHRLALAVQASLIALSSLLHGAASAQTIDDPGLWMAFFAQGNINECACKCHPLKWWFDGHLRLLEDVDGFNQSIVRPGLGWSLTENSALWAGYGWIHTTPLTGADFDEHRVWQQWTWSGSLEPLRFALRSRFEQRLLEGGDDTGLRFRQLFRVQHDMPHRPRMSLVCWDELFIHLNDTDWGAASGLDQNRIFAGIGLKARAAGRWRTEIGYLNQSINVVGPNNRSHHILSINLYRQP